MKTQHTPAPWFQNGKNFYVHGATADECVARIEGASPADRALLLRAVNSHEALLSAIKAAIRTPNIHTTDQETGETPYELMKEAIQQAEGK